MIDNRDFQPLTLAQTTGRGPSNRARGHLDLFQRQEDSLRIVGWIVDPKQSFQSARFRINDLPFGEDSLNNRNDLAQAFPRIPHAARAGFDITREWAGPAPRIVKATVIGCGASGKEATFETYVSTAPPEFPTPPAQHMNRVAGSDNAEAFHQSGLTGAINILAQISRYRDLGSLRTMLDWGCGCGRLSARMVDLVPHVALTGCDIDGEAIAWNKANFRNASFLAIEPYPPTPLPPASFDVVFGSSVMTHLTRQDQKLWIDEIHRILKPGGLFLSSVHGEFAASFFSGAFADLKKMQIIDARLDTALDGIAPPGYYRATFQTENFTRKHWGGKFRILDYVQAGLCSFQDLVLMEPR